MRKAPQKNQSKPSLIVHEDPKAISSEAFRVLRTNLQFTSPDHQLKIILITSAGPGEGKSTVASNLAIASAQSGRKVLLVGCDLRRPVLHHLFPVGNAPGLTGYLAGGVKLSAIVQPSTVLDLLEVVPAGPVPPNPAELLQSKLMAAALEQWKESYDLVIMDGAPVIAVTDSAILARQCDGAVLVIQAHQVTKEAALHAKTLLEQAQARILGVVLNGIRPQDQRNYQYYYYYDQAERAR